jgi:uncharacterized protein GlcG (DUF336 family)
MKLMLGLALSAFASIGFAQQPTYGPTDVTADQAKKIVAGSIAHAKQKGWPVAIAVVDRHGFLVYFERMEDTQTLSVQVAIDKAKTSGMSRRPSRVFEEGVAKGRNALLGLGGVTPITGGVPITVGGKVIGAIGVSGVTSDQDEEVAKAGLSGM